MPENYGEPNTKTALTHAFNSAIKYIAFKASKCYSTEKPKKMNKKYKL